MLLKIKVVLADAFLFDDMVELFGTSIISIDNAYRDKANLIMYSQVDKWIYEILEKSKNQTITVSSGSTKILKVLELLFEQNNISYFTVSSETTKREKELVYKEFQKEKPKWNVIMYSPTITVGISILAKSDHHFHLDRGNSMDVVSSIQMIKRNRSAGNIHLLLQERIKYNPTNLERIQQNLDIFIETDDDGDVLGISRTGKKFAKIHQLYNILENRHKVSFLYLLKYQFILNIIKNTEKIKPFVSKIGKLVTKNQIESDLDLFKQYKKMSPEEISDIEYQLFSTSKKDEKIKYFNMLKTDETLPKEYIDLLIEEEIKTPGIIDCYKNIKLNSKIVKSKNNYSYNIKEFNNYKLKNINLLEYGYKKEKNVYRLNRTLQKIID